MHKAWEQLPGHLRNAVEGRSAAHSYTARYSEPNSKATGAQPLTPGTARPGCRSGAPHCAHPPGKRPQGAVRRARVSPTRIVGLPDDESRDLLAQLYAHSVLPENIYRHQWQPHDLRSGTTAR